MKKTTFVTILILLLSFSSSQKVSATLPVFDYGNFGQSILSYVQGGLQYASELGTQASAYNTSVQATIDTTNKYVVGPMKDILVLHAIVSSKQQMQALVYGTMGKENALLVSNPERYLQNKTNDVTRGALGNLTEQKGPYSGSVMKNLIIRVQFANKPLGDKIAAINQSGIPAMEQTRRCTDEALSAQADADIKNSGTPYTQEAYIARKKELNNALCGDLSNPNTVAALTAINQQNPSLASFLAVTSGDNGYTRARQINEVIEARKNQVAQAAKEDYTAGGGIRSATTCTKRVSTKIDGSKYTEGDLTAPCIQEEIKQTAASINASFQDSFDTVKPQLSTIGNNASGIIATIGEALTTISLAKQLGSQLGVGDGGGNGGGGGSGGYTNDLLNNEKGKTNLTKTPLSFLSDKKSALTDLSGWETKNLDSINARKVAMDTMIACYESVVTDYPKEGESPVPELIAARNFYTSFYQTEINGTESTRGKIIQEQNLIQTENALINETTSKIQASQSTEEILNIFQTFQDTIKSQNLPEGITTSALRQGQYFTHEGLLKQSLSLQGDIYEKNETCTTFRADAQRRDASRNGGFGG